jgi:hypothetical protein
MDPTANLAEQRRLASRLADCETPDPADIARLAELVIALDEWIARGGALPSQWQAGR